MDDAKTCAIASLLYAKRPLLNFAHIVGELHTTLRNCPHKLIRVSWDHEDLAIFDLDGSRITLGWAEAEEGAGFLASLTIAIGGGDPRNGPDRLAVDREAMCRILIERVTWSHPTDTVIWQTGAPDFGPDDLDVMVDNLTALRPAEAAARAEARPRRETGRAAHLAQPIAAADVDVMLSRMEAHLAAAATAADEPAATSAAPQPATSAAPQPAAPDAAAAEQAQAERILPFPRRPRINIGKRSTTRPSPLSAMAGAGTRDDTIANDHLPPDLKALRDLHRVRDALYAEDPEEAARTPSVPMRLAVGALGSTLVIVALPVGAAVLTYNVLGGANFKVTARAMGLTGFAVGILQSGFGQTLLGLI